jgi:hypothetical protein
MEPKRELSAIRKLAGYCLLFDNCGGRVSLALLELRAYRTVMKPIQAVCDKCQKTVEAKPLLSENELWLALNKGDEIEVMHLADDVHHTWKLTGQDKESLLRARAAGTA